ncbi:EF-hand domain-containing protein [Thiovibrio frasassiensis]|uniref:EF-hand domain-containing protein n=1 Tax=Thiovibrio frasassiensis TaxID=2984131 RepID=A0A9X4RKN0_9BACT|nr:EF-hand domain-containing protein [Thiovibrio frasassiensis]MDG4475191.1 EF-hand domain-containing protein [Thiovibrio frasassiensis]
MVNSVSSSSSYAMQAMLAAMQGAQQRQGPQDLFKKVDLDSSGMVSQAEFQTLAEDISSKTGKSLSVDDTSFASYDADGSGELSGEELMAVMKSNGFGPPGDMQGAGEGGVPPSKDQAAAAYAVTSGGDSLSALIAGLQQLLAQLQSESGDQGTSTETASVGNGGSHHGPHDFFKKVDTDGSGGISLDELSTMATNIQDKTGQAITVDQDSFAAADSDGDGSLNTDELKAFMDKSGFAPPPPPEGMAMKTTSEDAQAESSKTKAGGQEQIDLLKIMLERLTKLSKAESTGSALLLNVTA